MGSSGWPAGGSCAPDSALTAIAVPKNELVGGRPIIPAGIIGVSPGGIICG